MSMASFRVALRSDPQFPHGWGLWSDERQGWLDVVYPSKADASRTLDHLLQVDRITAVAKGDDR